MQHFGIGLVALWHQTYLVMTGLFELRTDACLLVADFLEVLLQLTHSLLIIEQLFHRLTGLLHFGNHLWDTEVVGLAHQIGEQLVQLVVHSLQLWVVHHRIGDHNGSIYLVVVPHAEGHGLQPHHASEVFLQYMVAGVVTTGAEQTVGECDVLIVGHEVTWTVLSVLCFFHFLGNQRVGICIEGAVSEQTVGYGKEPDAVG